MCLKCLEKRICIPIMKKCSFGVNKVVFLGLVMISRRVEVDESKRLHRELANSEIYW